MQILLEPENCDQRLTGRLPLPSVIRTTVSYEVDAIGLKWADAAEEARLPNGSSTDAVLLAWASVEDFAAEYASLGSEADHALRKAEVLLSAQKALDEHFALVGFPKLRDNPCASTEDPCGGCSVPSAPRIISFEQAPGITRLAVKYGLLCVPIRLRRRGLRAVVAPPTIPAESGAMASEAMGTREFLVIEYSENREKSDLAARYVEMLAAPDVRLYAHEHYELISFPDRLGYGATVGAVSLWPGEETKLFVRSWQRSDDRTKSASSIFDSMNQESKQEFEDTLNEEQTALERNTKTKQWKVGGGFSINVKVFSIGGGGGTKHSSASVRENVAKRVMAATKKHAATVSQRRDVTVSTEQEVSRSEERENSSERRVRNMNLGSVMHMIARELTQQYEVLLTLVNYSFTLSNGVGINESASLEELGPLLRRFGNWEPTDPSDTRSPAHRTNEVISDLVAEEFSDIADTTGALKNPIEQVGSDLSSPRTYWRFSTPRDRTQAKCDLTGANEVSGVEGVIIGRSVETMRTGGVVFQAVLDPCEAVDDYSMRTREETIRQLTLRNQRESLILDLARNGDIGRISEAAKLLRCSADDVLSQILERGSGS